MDAIEPILDFALAFDLDDAEPAVVERGRQAVLDTLGAMYAGVTAEGIAPLTELAQDWGGRPQARLVVGGPRLPAPLAALVNGVAARAWDLDDVHEQLTCHIDASVVAAALAVADSRSDVSGKDFLEAVLVGSEFVCRLASAPSLSFSATGMAMTYQCAYLGAALAAARLLGLDKDGARHAIGVAYARLAGNQQGYVDGALTVRLMQGVAAEGGVIAAQMAEKGITGASEMLEGRFGYFNAFQRGAYDPTPLARDLGERWENRNVSIKPLYPCCKFTHGPIDATVDALAEAGGDWRRIGRLDVTVTNREAYDLVCTTRERKWRPETVTDAQFSLPFTMAFAAVRGGVGLDLLDPTALQDEDVLGLTQKVEVELDIAKQGDGRGVFPMPGVVTLTRDDGVRVERAFGAVKGHPSLPMTFDEVAEKARACAAFGLPGWNGVEAAIEAARTLERQPDISALLPSA